MLRRTLTYASFLSLAAATGLSSPASKSSAASSSSAGSCRYLTEDKPVICIEYRALKAPEFKSAREDCLKRSDQGAEWAAAACPEPGRVGLCKVEATAAKQQFSSTHMYYEPGFSSDGARIMCESAHKGRFQLL